MINHFCSSIYRRIAVVITVLFLVIILLFVSFSLLSARNYLRETTQHLHKDLPAFLVSKYSFFEDGEPNTEAIKQSFEFLMNVNPNLEIYLLDNQGRILAYSAPDEKVKRGRVSIGPIKKYLSEGKRRFPLMGDDPRSSDGRKIFAAAPVESGGERRGYLYVILEGEQYDSVASMLRQSYILRIATWAAVGALVFIFISVLFLFRMLTRRLRRLSRAMETFKESDFRAEVGLKAQRDRGGDEIDMIGNIFRDMAGRIRSQLLEIRRTERVRKELLSHISHDLRTPLTAIKGFLETLLMKKDELSAAQQETYLRGALGQGEKLERRVNDLFDLAKLEADEVRINPETFNLAELLQDIIQQYQLSIKKEDVTLKYEAPEELPFVRADIGLMERALQNLLDNALAHTPPGGTITLSLKTTAAGPGRGENVTLEVADTGRGIKVEDLPHIFESYYRAPGHAAGGSGLGLAITKRIADLHGIDIKVESAPERGTVFLLTFPAF